MVVVVAPSVAFGYIGGGKQPFLFHAHEGTAGEYIYSCRFLSIKFPKPLDSFMGERGKMKKIGHILRPSVIKCAIYTLKTVNCPIIL